MKILLPYFMIFLLGCNQISEGEHSYKVSGCEIPDIPYGAPAVKTRFKVNSEGKIIQVVLIQSSGSARIDQAAIKSVESCTIEIFDKKDEFWIFKDFYWVENFRKNK